jgi:hypothetical protein
MATNLLPRRSFPSCSQTLINNFRICLTKASRLGHRFFQPLLPAALVLVIFTVAHGAPRGSVKATTTRATNLPVTVSLSDYGAVGDGVTNDGPALKAALEALANAGGGTLFVPDGHYAIATTVSVDFAGRASAVTIQGTPSSQPPPGPGDFGAGLGLTAELHIKTGATHDAIILRNLDTLLVQDLVFIGDPSVIDDARTTLKISAIDDATFLRCEFYGLLSFSFGGGIITAETSGLTVADSAFLGCGGNSGTYTPIIQIYAWTGISITNTRFVDYGTRPGFYSKTTYMSPFSWVSIGGAAPLTNLSPRRDIIIKDVLLDEGAYYAVSVRPDLMPVPNGGPISLLYLSELFVNVTNLGEVGLRIQNVDNVFIEDSHFGWSHNTRGAMDLSYVKNAVLNHIECVASAHTIIAGPTVGELSVINSIYQVLDSDAPITRVLTTTPETAPGQYVQQKYQDILGHSPDLPGYVYWTQKRAACNDDAQCTTDEALLSYLNSNPAPTFSISGRLLDTNGAPLAMATVSLTGSHAVNTLTAADGTYTFAGLATAGEYTVTPAKTFYTFNGAGGATSRTFITPAANQTADFTGTLAKFSISGRVNDSNNQSLSGATVTLTGGPEGFAPQQVNSDGSGDYSFTNLPAGFEYTVTVTRSRYTFLPAASTITLAGNVVQLNFIGTPETYSISGRVIDGAEPIAGAVVRLSGSANYETTSEADGSFHFPGVLAGGNYTVQVTLRHYTFTSQTVTNLLDDWSGDFDGTRIQYTISGNVAEGSGGLNAVTVTLGGDQATSIVTDSSGNFAFTVGAGGHYTLTATKPGYGFSPAIVIYHDLDQNVYPNFQGTAGQPMLMVDGQTGRALAVNSITMLVEPFQLFTTALNFGPGLNTRLVLFGQNVPSDINLITAQAEDVLGNVYPLVVEFAGPLPDVNDVKQLNLKLDSRLATGADVKINIRVGGVSSNTVLVRINEAQN